MSLTGAFGETQRHWRKNFGEGMGDGGSSAGAPHPKFGVPEPTTLVLLMFAATGWCLRRGRAA